MRKRSRDEERKREKERHTKKIVEYISDYLCMKRAINIRTFVTILPVRTATPSWSKKKDKSVAWTVSQLKETNPVLFDSDGPVLGPYNVKPPTRESSSYKYLPRAVYWIKRDSCYEYKKWNNMVQRICSEQTDLQMERFQIGRASCRERV